MSLRTAIETLVAAVPPGTMVPVAWLADQLTAEAPASVAVTTTGELDLTVEQLGARIGRKPSTVRMWLARGELEGAYKLFDREWRIPPSAVVALQRKQASRPIRRRAQSADATAVDLGEWRRHVVGKRS